MTNTSAAIYGTGGMARAFLEVLWRLEWTLAHVFDDSSQVSEFGGVAVEPGDQAIGLNVPTFVCIGEGAIRQSVVERTSVPLVVAADPSSIVAVTATVGDGSILMHGAIIQAFAKVGIGCIVNTLASVDHDTVLHDFVHVAPQATLCGGVTVGARTEVGAGAVILPGITIGADCQIGAGAVVVEDVPPGVTVVGNPARPISSKDLSQ